MSYTVENQDAIVRSLIRQIFKEKPNHQFNKTQLMKLLYNLKKSLPSDDPIHEIIPYYWYYHGPMSEPVSHGVEFLYGIGALKKKRRFVFVDGNINYESLPVYIIKAVKSLLNGFNSWDNPKKYYDQIYIDDAPFEFSRPYRCLFLDKLEKYVEKMKNGQTTLGTFLDSTQTGTSRRVIAFKKTLYQCELKIPNIADFDEFGRLYSSFVGDAALVFDYLQSETNHLLLERTYDVAKIVCKTFAKGGRIQDTAHDPPYEKDVPRWRKDFAQNMKELELALDNFNMTVLREVRFDEEIAPYNEKQRDILSAVVDSYFADGK
jgi:hypothetical protein